MRQLLALLLALATGCGSAPARSADVDAPPSAAVRIGLADFEIGASSTRLTNGMIELRVTNAGATAHDLRIEGRPEGTEELTPGATTVLRVDATGAEELVLWCSLPGHRAQGMTRTLQVDT